MGARAALTCRAGFAGAAQSRTAKLPSTKQPNPLTSLMFAPISLYPFHVHQRESPRFDSSAQLRKFGSGRVMVVPTRPSPCRSLERERRRARLTIGKPHAARKVAIGEIQT